MNTTLHIINGDGAGNSLVKSEVSGEVLVCRELMYTGSRNPGWPNSATLLARAQLLSDLIAGGMDSGSILETLQSYYQKLSAASEYENIVLWFDACLCDQSMLAHILVCLNHQSRQDAELVCVNSFPGIEPFNGLGQLSPSQLASLYDKRCRVTREQLEFAEIVEKACAAQDVTLFLEISQKTDAPLPYVPAAITRWLQEQPDPKTGLGRLEHLALMAIRDGNKTPAEIFSHVAKAEVSPQFWGDTDLWRTVNSLAARNPPLVQIEGPTPKLPQWTSQFTLRDYKIEAKRC